MNIIKNKIILLTLVSLIHTYSTAIESQNNDKANDNQCSWSTQELLNNLSENEQSCFHQLLATLADKAKVAAEACTVKKNSTDQLSSTFGKSLGFELLSECAECNNLIAEEKTKVVMSLDLFLYDFRMNIEKRDGFVAAFYGFSQKIGADSDTALTSIQKMKTKLSLHALENLQNKCAA